MKWQGDKHVFYEWFEKADKEELKDYIYKKRPENFPLWKKWTYSIGIILIVICFYGGIIAGAYAYDVHKKNERVVSAIDTLSISLCADYGGKLSYSTVSRDGEMNLRIACVDKNLFFDGSPVHISEK